MPNDESKIRNFYNKWRERIGQEWIENTNVEELFQQRALNIPGWNEDVTTAAIRNWAIVTTDLNALWLDEEYSKNTKWGGIIAPPLFILSVHEGQPHGIVISSEARELGIPFDQSFNGGSEWEFFEPVRPGDSITYKIKLADFYEKEGRRANLTFVISEIRYYNQRESLIAIGRGTVILTRKSKLNVAD